MDAYLCFLFIYLFIYIFIQIIHLFIYLLVLHFNLACCQELLYLNVYVSVNVQFQGAQCTGAPTRTQTSL